MGRNKIGDFLKVNRDCNLGDESYVREKYRLSDEFNTNNVKAFYLIEHFLYRCVGFPAPASLHAAWLSNSGAANKDVKRNIYQPAQTKILKIDLCHGYATKAKPDRGLFAFKD